eukprot:gene2276-3136_t
MPLPCPCGNMAGRCLSLTPDKVRRAFIECGLDVVHEKSLTSPDPTVHGYESITAVTARKRSHQKPGSSPVGQFLKRHYRHFNAATVVDAAESYAEHIDKGGEMMLTMAGAMSTGELGISVADMIRNGKVHALCVTAANLEEDFFNLVAHDHYRRVPNWRELSQDDEQKLYEEGFNRVTDTCIPEEEA